MSVIVECPADLLIHEATNRVRTRLSRTGADIIEIGRDLILVKDVLPHGAFLPWIAAEFEMSEASAQRFMRCAEAFKSVNVTDLPPTVLYALAAPSTPAEVRDNVFRLAALREKVTSQTVADLKREAVSAHHVRELVPHLERVRADDLSLVNRTSFTGNNDWNTPHAYVEMARTVLGDIDLDPASNPVAQVTIKAAKFYTEVNDGLAREWHGRIWLNPPYAQPTIGYFIDKIVEEWKAKRVTAAIILTHNYTDTAWFQKLARASTAICFTKGRIRFIAPDGAIAAPTQGQAFFYLGAEADRFVATFGEGLVVQVAA